MALPPIQSPHRTQLGRLVDTRPCDFRTSVHKEDLSNSWPSATLRRHRASVSKFGEALPPARRFLEQVPRGMTRSYESVLHPRTRRELPPKRLPAQEAPFSLRLTPEAVLVIQKRSLEKQRSANVRRVFASRSSLQTSPPDVRELLKISLLNEQHRYDDMEYEDERWLRVGDDGLVRKCTEWLQGVEMAAGRGGNLQDKLQSLPHLNTF